MNLKKPKLFSLSLFLHIPLLISHQEARWCHRELPVKGGKFKLEPPYWQTPGCPNQPFDVEATRKCLKGRTVFIIGNSVARQNAFGLVEMLGGNPTQRDDQKTMCPKHDTQWSESCHQEFAGVKIRYLYLNYMDGFNYSDRNGAPFWRRRVNVVNADGTKNRVWKTGRLPGGKDLMPYAFGRNFWWYEDGDNCDKHKTRACLQTFFNGSTENDILIFRLGQVYGLNTTEVELQREINSGEDAIFWDMKAWLIASAVNFKSHLAATFKGKVFRVTMAQTWAYRGFVMYAFESSKFKEADKELAKLWQVSSANEHDMWYTIDQWAINENRNYLYNDQIHFQGPLSMATLQQVLNELCPGGGNATMPNVWPHADLAGHYIAVENSHKPPLTTTYYFIDKRGNKLELTLNSTSSSIPWYMKLSTKSVLKMTHIEVSDILDGPTQPYIPEDCVVRGDGREVYWLKNDHKYLFPSGNVFMAHGFEWDQIIPVDQLLLNGIPEGEWIQRDRHIRSKS